MRASVLLIVISAVIAVCPSFANPVPPVFPPRSIVSSIYQYDKPYDAMWGNMIQMWDFQTSTIYEKIFYAGNLPFYPATAEYSAFFDGQAVSGALLANGSCMCVTNGPVPMPPQNFSDKCKYSGDADFFGEPAHRFSCDFGSAFSQYNVYTSVRADHPWPFIGEYAAFAGGSYPSLYTRVMNFEPVTDYAPGIEHVPDWVYQVCKSAGAA